MLLCCSIWQRKRAHDRRFSGGNNERKARADGKGTNWFGARCREVRYLLPEEFLHVTMRRRSKCLTPIRKSAILHL